MNRSIQSTLSPLPSIFCFFLLASLLTTGCNQPGPNHDAMIASAQRVDSLWMEAFNHADIDGLMGIYWNDPTLLAYPADATELHGWEQVRSSYERMLANMRNATAFVSETRYTVAGDVVICYGKWTITIPTEEGPVFKINGRYSDVKAERDGKWVIIMEHGSVPMPPPADANLSM